MRLRFYTVDVFTSERFGGNQLAVVLAADDLSTAQMQLIAREFNLSETTFVCRSEQRGLSARVRIFTPGHEMPFAGHPNVGTGYVLANVGADYGIETVDGVFRFEERAGVVPVEVLRRDGRAVGARLRAPQRFTLGGSVGVAQVAQACGLSAADVNASRHDPTNASCGAPFTFVELKSRDALRGASPSAEAFVAHFPNEPSTGSDPDTANAVLMYVRDESQADRYHARMFAPLHGIAEDAATGSANVALAGLLAHLDDRSDLSLAARVEQGRDMGRPSTLAVGAEKRAGVVETTSVGGECVHVMQGELTI